MVALPAPSLYAQANNLDDINIVLTALKDMGFENIEVFNYIKPEIKKELSNVAFKRKKEFLRDII